MEETIKIKKIDKKESGLVIVGYTVKGLVAMPINEATLNTKWQSQEVDFLEKDVGIGGEVKVTIVEKGQYVNITKVDMTSAVKGLITESEKIVDSPKEAVGLMSVKDTNINAGMMTKCFYYGNKASSVEEVYDRFNAFKKLVENNG